MNMWDRFINWLEFKPKPPATITSYDWETDEASIFGDFETVCSSPFADVFEKTVEMMNDNAQIVGPMRYLECDGLLHIYNTASENTATLISEAVDYWFDCGMPLKPPTKRSKAISPKKAMYPKGRAQDKRSEAVVKRKKDVKSKPSKKRTKKYV